LNPRTRIALAVLAAVAVVLSGCGPAIKNATPEDLTVFAAAGPVTPVLDVDRMVQTCPAPGAYRVVAGDVLDLQIPVVATAGAAESAGKVETVLARVGESGRINLPIAGEAEAAGKTLSEIEAAVSAAYYPKYVTKRPNVVARVADYRTRTATVVGAVNEPGTYPLRHDELSLVTLLMKAKGIVAEGAAAIRIRRAGAATAEPIALPVKGLNVPFADAPLQEGDVVEVERLKPEVFTVVGLVNRPGAFPYPPGAQFTLAQALAFAGGVNMLADPQFCTVYRQAADGKVVAAAFKLDGAAISGPSNVAIKPGDVVSLEHDARTQTRTLLVEMLRFGFGVNASYEMSPTSR
jgi:polysaccharide export outer membrane protein